MLPYVRHWPQRWRVPLAFWLTDTEKLCWSGTAYQDHHECLCRQR